MNHAADWPTPFDLVGCHANQILQEQVVSGPTIARELHCLCVLVGHKA